jgi:tetratricopeptide (TPR) repeat protein
MLLSLDRLKVFVSSTIKECSKERAIVRDAIISLNHEPVLFEEVGARPYPPRKLYKTRLEMSQIFVAIYRESYGWIAPGMEISGVEDELQLASQRKMDRLIYVFKSPTNRDPKLKSLIEVAMNSGLTVFSYSTPEQLRDRVRDDITAVISGRFVDQAMDAGEGLDPDELLSSLLPDRAHRFRRVEVEAKLLKALSDNGRVLVTAPLGAGKTTMLAQLAAKHGWIFVDAQGLSALDVLGRLANAVRQRLGLTPIVMATEKSAVEEILRRCEALTNPVLAIDSVAEPLAIWNLQPQKHRLVMTSRSAFEVPLALRFELPPLSRHEIGQWVTGLRGVRPENAELNKLSEKSGGNPLYLRFYALGEAVSADLSLQELEIRAFQSLSASSREIISYLALSSAQLSLRDLQRLTDPRQGPEFVADNIAAANSLLRQSRRHVQLVHEHLRTTVLDQLRGTPTKLDFFVNQLGRYLEGTKRYVAAFYVYLEGEEQARADRILDEAGYQAGLMGGGAPAIPIYKRQIQRARELGKSEVEVQTLLALVFAYTQTGAREDALHALEEARTAAARTSNLELTLMVREGAVGLELGSRPREERIQELVEIRNSYVASSQSFNVARVGVSIAAEYIAHRDFQSAELISRESLEYFASVGDEYGIRVAKVNLASSLSGMRGHEQEAAEIFQQLQQDFDPDEYPRERAAVCNFLTRRYRRLKDFARASQFAIEAIGIGEQLEDLHLIAINRINLGNVRRDESAFDKALEEYRTAEQAALKGQNVDDEASANELVASVLNQQEKYALALQHASHAVLLAERVGDPILLARAEEERATALTGQRETEGAVNAYVNAARAIAGIRPEDPYYVSLVTEGLSLCTKSRRHDLKIQLLTRVFAPSLEPMAGKEAVEPLRVIFGALPSVAKTIRANHLLPIVALSVGDLLADAPPVVERQLILALAVDVLKSPEIETTSALAMVAAILMAHSGNSLNLLDLVNLADSISNRSGQIYFKPHSDGASHWNVVLDISDGVIVTVSQLDDSPRTAVIAMILVLLLKILDRKIRRAVLDTQKLPRLEAIINIASRGELEAQLGPELLNLGDMPDGFKIAESTDLTSSEQPPIVIICAADFGKAWQPEKWPFSDVVLLLGELLRPLTGHLLAKTVEPDVLFPKISSLIRSVGYWGSSDDEEQ